MQEKRAQTSRFVLPHNSRSQAGFRRSPALSPERALRLVLSSSQHLGPTKWKNIPKLMGRRRRKTQQKGRSCKDTHEKASSGWRDGSGGKSARDRTDAMWLHGYLKWPHSRIDWWSASPSKVISLWTCNIPIPPWYWNSNSSISLPRHCLFLGVSCLSSSLDFYKKVFYMQV